MQLLHTCLNVTNMDRAVEFYTGSLDFEETWGFTTPDGETENRYMADENGVELQLSSTDGEDDLEAGTAWDHLAVTVDDVEEALETINHYGVVRESMTVEAANARVAFVNDPDGHVVELIQPLPDEA